jgi:Cu2+-exporting ATPase
MKTSVIKIDDMLSVWSLDEVENQIGAVPGVESVTVNFAAESATVRYDETRVAVSELKSTVRQLGQQSAAPAKNFPAADTPAKGAPAKDAPTQVHEDHIDDGEPAATLESAPPKSKAETPAATHDAHAGHEQHDDTVPDASKSSSGSQPDTPEPSSDHAGHDSHDKHQGHSPEKFRNRF